MSKLSELTDFLSIFPQKIKEVGVDVSNYNMDHVAYQASSAEDYTSVVSELSSSGKLLQEPLIGGRRIAMIKLKDPIEFKGNTIIALEVLEPTEGQTCKSGWEHAEYVIDGSFEELMQKYPELPWITPSINRPVWAHLKLKLSDNMQVKFHNLDILETIRLEKKQRH